MHCKIFFISPTGIKIRRIVVGSVQFLSESLEPETLITSPETNEHTLQVVYLT